MFAQNIDCGYTLEPPHLTEAVLTRTHTQCFGPEIRKNRHIPAYPNFTIQKWSSRGYLILHGHVFLMQCNVGTQCVNSYKENTDSQTSKAPPYHIIFVQDPVSETSIIGPYQVTEGSPFNLTCSADSNPRPVYWWTMDPDDTAPKIRTGIPKSLVTCILYFGRERHMTKTRFEAVAHRCFRHGISTSRHDMFCCSSNCFVFWSRMFVLFKPYMYVRFHFS